MTAAFSDDQRRALALIADAIAEAGVTLAFDGADQGGADQGGADQGSADQGAADQRGDNQGCAPSGRDGDPAGGGEAAPASAAREAPKKTSKRAAKSAPASTSGAQNTRVAAVLGRAGSGKTYVLAQVVDQLIAAGAKQIIRETDTRKASSSRAPSFAVVAPTNKAASVLRARGVAATTIHRIIYSPVYDPDYEALADWLAKGAEGAPPTESEAWTPAAIDRARAVFSGTKSAPAALATVGLRGSDFITGWKRRDETIAIGLVDEASMLDTQQLDDLREIFGVVILFGDPAQLAPVGQSDAMAFASLPAADTAALARVHRQTEDNPILDLAYALQEDIPFDAFEERVREAAARDDRVVVSPQVDADLMARAPALVWRNATRIRLIHAFRAGHGLAEDALSPGEPLMCDGFELSARNRHRRIDLEAAGLVKGAQAFWLHEGRKPGFAQIYVVGAPQPKFGVAAIIHIERPGASEPFLPTAARSGAVFVHGAACTIHKSQGGQWPTAQVFAPDLFAAARSGRIEDGVPLWRRLAYVAITRAEERLIWATRYALRRPTQPLTIEDLTEGPLL